MANNLPSVTSPLPRDLQVFIQRVREAIDGGGLDGLVTARQMVVAGLASFSNGVVTSTASPVEPPRPPTGLAGSGALASVIVSWDGPTYSGHSYTEIWAATQTSEQVSASQAPLASQAILVGMTAGDNFSHGIGSAATRYYWVKNVNQNGLASAFNATAGVAVTTGSDPAYVLSVLSDQITTSQLHNDLETRIDLIDGAASLTGSVNARVLAEASSRVSAIDTVEAKYTIKIDNGGHISGYGLISTNNDDGTPTSEFGVRADNFWVAPPTTVQATEPTSGLYKGYAWKDSDDNVTRYWDGSAFQTTPQTIPFAVRSANQTINGVTVPAGVYIDTAMIADATITNAKIGSLTADKITASLLNTVDFYGNTIAGSTIYLGGTVTYGTDAGGNNTSISGVSAPKIAMNNTGATFKVDAFKVDNGASGTATPFQVVNDSVFIDSAVIKDAAITTAKIDNAAITTAKIQNANITTLKIADEQITATRSIAYTVPSADNRDVDQTFNLSFPHTADYVIILGVSRALTGSFNLSDYAEQNFELYIDGTLSARLYTDLLVAVLNSNIRSHLQTINHTYDVNGALGTVPVRLKYTLTGPSGMGGGATSLRVSFQGAVK